MNRFCKNFLISSATILLISQTSLASPKPDKCPNAAVLQYRGFLVASKECGSEKYFAAQYDKYGTSEAWAFGVLDISATNTKEALDKATVILDKLKGEPQPEDDGQGGWLCRYQTGEQTEAIAFSFHDDEVLPRLSKLVKK